MIVLLLQLKDNMYKHRTPINQSNRVQVQASPSKVTVINWIKSITSQVSPNIRVEDLGSGVVYCQILNYYFGSVIPSNKIILAPKDESQCRLNLKLFEKAAQQLKLTVPFEITKISKKKPQENWFLALSLYKQLSNRDPYQNQTTWVQPNNLQFVQKKQITPYEFKPLQKNIPQYPSFQIGFGFPGWGYQQSFLPMKFPQVNSGQAAIRMNQYFSQTEPKPSREPKEKTKTQYHILKINYTALLDRTKQILLKNINDHEKVQQIKVLYNMGRNYGIDQPEFIKIEDDSEVQNISADQLIFDKERQVVTGRLNENNTSSLQQQKQKQNIKLEEKDDQKLLFTHNS